MSDIENFDSLLRNGAAMTGATTMFSFTLNPVTGEFDNIEIEPENNNIEAGVEDDTEENKQAADVDNEAVVGDPEGDVNNDTVERESEGDVDNGTVERESEGDVEEEATNVHAIHGSSIDVEEIGDDRGEAQESGKKWQAREMEYKKDKVARHKIFYEKKKRMMKIAEQMKVICGASVKIQLQADTGNSFHYSSNGEAQSRHVKTQYGPSFIESYRSRRTTPRAHLFPSNNTPTKPSTPHHSHEPSLPNQPSTSGIRVSTRTTPTVVGLPGRKANKTPPRAKDSSKCGKCKRIFGGKADLKFQKEHKREASWIGCQGPDCGYWCHAMCVNIKVGRSKLEDIPFLCPAHNL